MSFNVYFISIPVFLLMGLVFGSYNMKKVPMAACGFIVASVTVFSVTAESFRGLVSIFDKLNGFDTNAAYALFEAMVACIVIGVAVGVAFYKLSTRNSKPSKSKKRNRSRADYGEFNEMVYGKTCTPVELVEVLC